MTLSRTGLDHRFEIVRQIEPVLFLRAPGDKRPFAPDGFNQTIFPQHIESLANRNPRDLEFGLELLDGGDLLAFLPMP